MMLFQLFTRLRSEKKNNKRVGHGRRKRSNMLHFESLESRQLLAGISFDAGTGEVTVFGDSGANIGLFKQINSTTYRASLSGIALVDYNVSDVNKITFIGFGGDDQFTNSTGVEGLLLGNDGNDTLIGGSGFDQINGGADNDEIRGNAGNDRLIGGLGDDMMFGGTGDDTMFGGDGANTMDGDAGNDLMFGGNNVDTMDGGNGIDQLFGLDGDDILSSGNGGVAGSSDTNDADLVMGLGGNDTISGGNGLNVFYGGDGDDVMEGGYGENRMHGQNGNDTLTGGAFADYLAGNNDDDTIVGLGGNDYITPGFGDDTVDGGTGVDFVVYSQNYADYQITGVQSVLTIVASTGGDGTDTVTEVSKLRFADGDQDAVSTIREIVTVQPILVSNSNGSNSAGFFGSPAQELIIKGMIDDIFYQADVAINWLTTATWNNSFANVGNTSPRPNSDLGDVIDNGDAAGVGSTNSKVLDMYLVEVAAGFASTPENTANGLAFVGGNGITAHIGDDLVSYTAGQLVVARVIAHEIAHNLGLNHVNNSTNLMDDGDDLTPSQINTILSSQYTVPV